MRRRVLAFTGIVLSLLGAAPFAGAQDLRPYPTIPFIPSIPSKETSALGDPSKPGGPIADIKISPNTGMPRLGEPQEATDNPLVEAAVLSSEYMDPRYVANSQFPDYPGIWERLRSDAADEIHRSIDDLRYFYLTADLFYVGIPIAVAAPIANTHADVGIRNWYQRQAGVGRSRAVDETANFFKHFGEYRYGVPIYLFLFLGGDLFPESPMVGTASEWGKRSLRALGVGAPMVGMLQVGLGSDRPFTDSSRWQPFRSNHGASGHAFVGAVPFLTAAAMTDSYVLKTLFVAGSLAPAWSRMHTDDHYFSQVLLGWSIAYLSVHAVNQTESRYRIVPIEVPNGVGMGVEVKF